MTKLSKFLYIAILAMALFAVVNCGEDNEGDKKGYEETCAGNSTVEETGAGNLTDSGNLKGSGQKDDSEANEGEDKESKLSSKISELVDKLHKLINGKGKASGGKNDDGNENDSDDESGCKGGKVLKRKGKGLLECVGDNKNKRKGDDWKKKSQ